MAEVKRAEVKRAEVQMALVKMVLNRWSQVPERNDSGAVTTMVVPGEAERRRWRLSSCRNAAPVVHDQPRQHNRQHPTALRARWASPDRAETQGLKVLRRRQTWASYRQAAEVLGPHPVAHRYR